MRIYTVIRGLIIVGLIIACDGGEVVASYLVNNSIKPDKFVFNLYDLTTTLRYLNPQTDSVLLIVSGMTELSNSVILRMCELLESYEGQNKVPLDYEILSNLPLAIKQTYTFYHDDLLYGSEELMLWVDDKFKTVPIKKREDKAITKYIGTNAAQTVYTPLVRQYQGTPVMTADMQKLLKTRRNIFDF